MTGADALQAAGEATWPAVFTRQIGTITLREGRGGGQRVSAATAAPGWSVEELDEAEQAMADLGQPCLFLVRAGDGALDAALEARGYRVKDPSLLYSAPIDRLGPAPDPMTAFPHWPPLAIARAIWAEQGIGPERLAVMERASAPHCALLGRSRDRPAGAAFVALSGETAMLHALAVPESLRRQGIGGNLVRAAAVWAGQNGATVLGLAVTAANAPARALYASLGLEAVGQYHYRVK